MLLYIFALFVVFLYYFGTRNYKYWEKKGIKTAPPIPFFGNALRQSFRKISLTDLFAEQYWKFPDERVVGMYMGSDSFLILRDPELIKQILVTDFNQFYPRGINPHKEVIEPMLKNLFFADGDLWKMLRQRMTPAFTSGKLKGMFPLIVERAHRLRTVARNAANKECDVDVRELMARYTTDFIGACGFGIDADSLSIEDSPFRKLGKDIYKQTPRDIFVTVLKIGMPETFKHLEFFRPGIESTTVTLVKDIMSRRNYKPSGRNDFIDLLLELKEKGKIVCESIEKFKPDGTPEITELELDDLLMAAQVFVFFAAGFETSSSATSFTLHQLAFHPEIQTKCQQEIDTVLARHGNELSYDAVKEMKYLEMTFREAMRMFPSLGYLVRKCVRPYTLPGTDIRLNEDVTVIVPLQALHNDEKYFDKPEEFRPERFLPEAMTDIQKHVYLPFGVGPRACVAGRLGLMQSLAGLAAVLQTCSVRPGKTTLRHPISDPVSTIVQSIKGGLPLALVSRS